MNSKAIRQLRVIDSHTGGEPTRVVAEGGPVLGGGSLVERRERFREQYDHFRPAIVHEPRGSSRCALSCEAARIPPASHWTSTAKHLAAPVSETGRVQGAIAVRQRAWWNCYSQRPEASPAVPALRRTLPTLTSATQLPRLLPADETAAGDTLRRSALMSNAEVQYRPFVWSVRTMGQSLRLLLNVPATVLRPTVFARFLLRHFEPAPCAKSSSALDLGTGCGILALVLKRLGFSEVDATDTNEHAVAAARANAELNRCDAGLRVMHTDLFGGLDRKYGLVVSNPPTFPRPQDNGCEHGIGDAFFAGKTGREFIDSVADTVSPFLLPRGKLLLLVPSYLDPERTLRRLVSHGLLAGTYGTMHVPVNDYVRHMASHGLDGLAMINAAYRESRLIGVERPFLLDRQGRPLAFWLKLVLATKPE